MFIHLTPLENTDQKELVNQKMKIQSSCVHVVPDPYEFLEAELVFGSWLLFFWLVHNGLPAMINLTKNNH